MDKSGEGEEIELENLVHARELSFIGFTHDMFQEVRTDALVGSPALLLKCELAVLALSFFSSTSAGQLMALPSCMLVKKGRAC